MADSTNLPDIVSQVEALKSHVPVFLDPRKTEYLEYRACCFSPDEAVSLMNLNWDEVKQWREQDPHFRVWENQHLSRLQSELAGTLVKSMFYRCAILTLKADTKALEMAAYTPESMTESQRDWAKDAAKRYKAADIAILEKAVAPGNDDMDQLMPGTINIRVSVGEQTVVDEYAKRAAHRQLLDDFTRTGRVVDAESKVVD